MSAEGQIEVTKSFELSPNERLLRKALARSYQPPTLSHEPRLRFHFFSEGRLYLTDRRLFWERSWFNVPFLPVQSFEIQLQDVLGSSVRGSGFAIAFGGGGLYLAHADAEYRFQIAKQRLWPPALWYSKVEAQQWQSAIDEARRALARTRD